MKVTKPQKDIEKKCHIHHKKKGFKKEKETVIHQQRQARQFHKLLQNA